MQNNNLDDFMPKDLQRYLLNKGLKTFSTIISKNQFKILVETVNKVNDIEMV